MDSDTRGARPAGEPQLIPARSLDRDALTDLFNLGFSGYLLPMRMDPDGLREHIAVNDIDLDRSIVAADPDPVGFVLVGRRGSVSWIGGMGIAPERRRTGLGARLLAAAIAAGSRDGLDSVWLEVLDTNQAAIGLYESLGFERVRHLSIWSLPPAGHGSPEHDALDLDAAHLWIAAHRDTREPWQRADASLMHMRERGARLRAVAVHGSDGIAGAAICKTDGVTVTIIQLAARDRAAARDLVMAAAGAHTLRLSNLPSDHMLSEVLRVLGADLVVAQHEMRRGLSAGPPAGSPPDAAAGSR